MLGEGDLQLRQLIETNGRSLTFYVAHLNQTISASSAIYDQQASKDEALRYALTIPLEANRVDFIRKAAQEEKQKVRRKVLNKKIIKK